MKKVFTTTKIKGSNLAGLMLALLLTGVLTAVNAQQYLPRHYWTFEGASPLKDSMNLSALNPTFYNGQFNYTQGNVGTAMSLGNGGRAIVATSNLALDTMFTAEFLFKADHDFNSTNLLNRRDNAVIIRMGYAFIQFTTNVINTAGATISDNFVINLESIGRASYSYYVDNNWHHLVFKYNSNSGQKEVWVDGQLPTGFSTTTGAGKFNPNSSNANNNVFDINSNTTYYRIFGQIDEIALYNTTLPANSIYKHYQNIQAGQHYSFAASTIAPPAAASVSGPVDINEYALGHPTYSTSALDQLKSYPLPRYKKNHTLLANFDWLGLRYFGGEFQSGVSQTQAIANTVEIQRELAKNFNYSILVSGNTSTYTQYNDPTKFHGAWVQLANQNPQWSAGAITFWAQMNPQNAGFSSNTGYIENKTLPANHYLTNSAGQFIGLSGSTSTTKFWSPAAPIDSFIKDGLTQKLYLQNLLNSLSRPLNFICENGEVIPKPTSTAMQADPSIVSDKATTTFDWDTYLGNRKMRIAKTYSNQFLNNLTGLSNTNYAEYQISGLVSRHKYSETRTINKPINGQIYATPDFYPRWSNNWLTGTSAWTGWKQIIEGRYYEIQQNDKLYSPFVAAGWNADEERNIRPAQWLGLLKALSMTGAEFFYTGYFNEAASYNPPNPAPSNPAGYAWQAAMPSYAQAITSRFEDILRNGDLLPGDVPYSVSSTNPGYSFNAGDQRKLVVIRKHSILEKYAITGSIQPNSNMQGNAEIEGEAKITLNGQTLQFNIRRQGSTYIYDNTNPASPVFIQLDGWHEASHPSRWSKDFNLEAELFDNTPTNVAIKTQRPTGTVAGDFRQYTSYIGFTAATSNTVEYNFTPRINSNYYVWVKARSKSNASAGLSIALNGTSQKTISCITDTAWQWYSLDACSGLAISFNNLNTQEYTLQLTASSTNLEIDRVILTIDGAINMNPTQQMCGASVATVTQNGPVNFCQGGSVTLTASTGNTYAWSSGQTTQSITVNSAGNYSVAVGNGLGCNAISTPIAVTVLNRPSALIAAAGSTSLCNGQSVALNASTGASYLWSNGATSQQITVNTASNYAVTVTGLNGCTATSSNQVVTVNQLPTAQIIVNGSTTLCQGGSVVLTATGGTSYLWSNGTSTASTTINTTGNYNVIVTNSNNCSATSSTTNIQVSANPSVTVTGSGTTSFCLGGSITLTATGGTSYQWSTGETGNSIIASTTGNYSVIASNGSGCTTTSIATQVTAWANPAASITVNGNTTLISGQNTSLTASAGSSFLWIPNGETTSSINVNTAGNYSVQITDNHGCSATSGITTISQINQPAPVSIQATGNTTLCAGQSVALNANGGSNLIWAPGGQTTSSISVTQSGTYFVYSRDSQGNVISIDSASVIVNDKPMAPWISYSYVPNQSYQLTAYEPSAVNYLWSNGQTTSSINVTTSQTLSVKATNAFGCISDYGKIDVGNETVRSCANPEMLTAYNLSDTTANLQWNPAVSGEITKLKFWVTNSALVNTITLAGNASSTRLNNLAPATTYNWSIELMCASGNYVSQTGIFKTLGTALSCGSTPMHLRAENISTTNATLRWYNTTAQTYKVRYRAAGTSIYTYKILTGLQYATGVLVNNLSSAITYEWQVQTTCNGYTSPYSQPSYFSTIDTCGYISSVAIQNIKTTSATFVWGNTTAMDTVRIRVTNVATGVVRIIVLNYNPSNGQYQVKGLHSNTTYKAEVKGKCSSGAPSTWSTPTTFTTAVLSSRAEEGGVFQLIGYPNPASDVLSYTFSTELKSDYLLNVTDISGRTIIQETRNAQEGENTSDINVTSYAKGIYIMTIQIGTETSRFKFTVQ